MLTARFLWKHSQKGAHAASRRSDVLFLPDDVPDGVVQADVVRRGAELRVEDPIAQRSSAPDPRRVLPHHLREMRELRVRRVIYTHRISTDPRLPQQRKKHAHPSPAKNPIASAGLNAPVPAARFSPTGPSAPPECWKRHCAAYACAFVNRPSSHVSGAAPCCARSTLWPSRYAAISAGPVVGAGRLADGREEVEDAEEEENALEADAETEEEVLPEVETEVEEAPDVLAEAEETVELARDEVWLPEGDAVDEADATDELDEAVDAEASEDAEAELEAEVKTDALAEDAAELLALAAEADTAEAEGAELAEDAAELEAAASEADELDGAAD